MKTWAIGFHRRTGLAIAVAAGFLVAPGIIAPDTPAGVVVAQEQEHEQEREREDPELSLRARPMIAFSPTRVSFTAELRGGDDDHEDYYCLGVEWEWGDGTISESSYDCDPYEAGVSQINRRFTAQHVFREPGYFDVRLRLKKRDEVVDFVDVTVQVRPGLGRPPMY